LKFGLKIISKIPPTPLKRGSKSCYNKRFNFLLAQLHALKKIGLLNNLSPFKIFYNPQLFILNRISFPFLRGLGGLLYDLLLFRIFCKKQLYVLNQLRNSFPLFNGVGLLFYNLSQFRVFRKPQLFSLNSFSNSNQLRNSFPLFNGVGILFYNLSQFRVFHKAQLFILNQFSNSNLLRIRFPLKRGLGGLLLLLLSFNSFSQQDTLNKKRLKTVVLTESVGYTGAMVGLYSLWYKDGPSSSFHTFNDNKEWLQMDKIGHGVTTYYVGKVGYEALKWSGVSRKKSIWYGGTLGLFFLTSVEVFDGYSSAWGFSWGDVAVNTAGAGTFIGQQLLWDEQRILLKYSYHKGNYTDIRPDLLGENLLQNTIKDYNGQTYWASANIASFLREGNNFPKWLNVAVGYGADGMVGAFNNDFNPTIKRYRQYYVSLDIDLTRIKTKSKFFNTVFGAFGFLKFPMPTIEFNQHGKTKFYGVYF